MEMQEEPIKEVVVKWMDDTGSSALAASHHFKIDIVLASRWFREAFHKSVGGK